MPAGCNCVGQAIELFLGMMADADRNEIDHRVQLWIEPKYGTVFQACLNSTSGPEDVLKAVHEEARAHISAKLGDARSGLADFAAMFQERFRTPRAAEQAVEETFHEAEPSWIGTGPWVGSEVTVVSCPGGREGEALRELARRAIPVAGLPFADTFNALNVYREWPGVPVSALPHAGAVGITAFQDAASEQQCTPHARVDVEMWTGIDAHRVKRSLRHAELVDRRLLVGLARLEDRVRLLLPLRLVHRVRELLGFQAEPVVLLVHRAALAHVRAVQEVAGVELQARLGREHLQHPARSSARVTRAANSGLRRLPLSST